MTTVFHETLPESYLLLLTPGSPTGPQFSLDFSLRCACRSGKTAVWVDCGLLLVLSPEAARTLCDYYLKLQEEHKQLVVVHASDDVKQALLSWQLAPSLCFAPTLIDAAWHSSQRLAA
ncbi:hypothetical protein [Hymenobacter glacialis]|uniref:STAS domain-containing protein n=1 Tax=Hymenobacter glacialis TaxID=1908236 RepID=A0A1G1T881_9BACT|nr:hypothetical protein [Hymenobacter glacialis]OGX87081.1 hypothetical protein BEN48_11945 [Hymenobacter glacialis]